MEGGAIAQVAEQEKNTLGFIRVISDNASEAPIYLLNLLRHIIKNLGK